MSLCEGKNVGETISQIVLDLRATEAAFRAKEKRKKCLQTLAAVVVCMITGLILFFIYFNNALANFVLLTWTIDAPSDWQLVGLYVAGLVINAIEWLVYLVSIDKSFKQKCCCRGL